VLKKWWFWVLLLLAAIIFVFNMFQSVPQ